MNRKIQITRAVAAIAVVAIHTCPGGYKGIVLRQFMNFAVALFIFISGYLTSINKIEIKTFYKKRILKVLIPYSIWSVLYTIACGTYKDFAINLLTGRCCEIYYFIIVYIQFVIITPLIAKMYTLKNNYLFWLITPVAVGIQYIQFFVGKAPVFPWNANNFLVWFIYYYLGIMLGNKIITKKISKKVISILLLIAIILSEIEGYLLFKVGYYDMAKAQIKISSMLASLVIIYMAYLYINSRKYNLRNKKIENLLVKIGDESFGIYLSHMLVTMFLFKLIPVNLKISFPLNTIIIFSASFFCCVAGGKILGKGFGKYLGIK